MQTTNVSPQARTKIVSIFKPHHATQVLYPSRRLLKDGESPSITFPHRVHDRFEPHPIVPDAAVILNKSGGNESVDTDFTTYNATSLWPDDEVVSTGDLFADMDTMTQHIGCTKLRVLLFNVPAAATPGVRPELHNRLNRLSRLEMPGGKVHYDQVEYSMRLQDFDVAVAQTRQTRGTLPCWAKDVVELVRTTSDRAVLHVRQRCSAVGWNLPNYNWKPPRTITLKKAIPHFATVMTKTELSEYNSTLPDENDHITECPCCTEEFDDPDTTDPVKLPCSKRHVLCFPCVQNICKTSGLTKVRCPWCAVLLANDGNRHVLQPNYLDLSAPFHVDPRFTKYENFERGVADLDSGHVRNDTTKVLISKARFDFIWELYVHTSPSPERPERLWRDHRCVPEYKVVNAAFHAFCNGWNGESWPVNEVFKQFRHMIFFCLANEWKKGELYSGHTDKRKHDVEQDHSKVPLRPGFVEFIDRALNRVLRFMVVRRCEQYCGTLCGLHSHGERLHCKVYWATREDDFFAVQVETLRKKRKARSWALV